MTLLAPLALILLAILPAVILIIHWLRGRSRRVRVPAIFLWAGLPPAVSGTTRLRRPPLTILLALQLLAAAALALALARPATPGANQPRHLALVIDASASMQATDIVPNRFEVARAEALRRLDQLQPSDRVTLVRAGAAATIVAEGSPAEARSELRAAQPGGGRAALRDAIALAERQIAAAPEDAGAIVVVTDGAFGPLNSIGVLTAPVEFVPVPAAAGDNQAVSAVVVRSQPSGQGREAYVQLVNLADRAVRRPLRALDPGSGQVLATREVDLPTRGITGVVIALPEGVGHLEVQLDTGDRLPLDDRAEVPVSGGRESDVLLVSAEPAMLQHALEAIPGVELRVVEPGAWDGTAGAADLTVLDGFVPDPLPPGPLLLVNPPAGNPLLPVAAGGSLPVTTTDPGNALLAGVDVAALNLDQVPGVAPPAWARPVVAHASGALVLDGRHAGRPVVVFAFDPMEAGRDRSLAFPILTGNAVARLLAERDDLAIAPGQTLTFPAPPSGEAVVVRPDGSREPVEARGSDLTIGDTDRVGRYRVEDASDPQTVLATFSVNVLDPEASDIRPRADLAPLPAGTVVPHAALAEWWRLLVAVGVVLLGLEWLVFARRG